jgi:hypothetical protein
VAYLALRPPIQPERFPFSVLSPPSGLWGFPPALAPKVLTAPIHIPQKGSRVLDNGLYNVTEVVVRCRPIPRTAVPRLDRRYVPVDCNQPSSVPMSYTLSVPFSSAENRGSSGYPKRGGRVGRAFTGGRNPLQVHSPYDISVKHAFLATHLRLNMPFREMLLTRQSVLPSLLPTTFGVPDIPRRTTCPHGPFVHSIVKLHDAHMDSTTTRGAMCFVICSSRQISARPLWRSLRPCASGR